MLEKNGEVKPLDHYIGKVLNADVTEGYIKEVADADTVRVIVEDPNMGYTLDYVAGRINVVVDKANKIVKFFRG